MGRLGGEPCVEDLEHIGQRVEIGGESFTLTADQVLSGSNWVAI